MTRSIPRLLGYATVGAGVTAAGYVGLVTGACPIDLGIGRRVRPLGPQLVDMAAPREVVFDVLAQPYLGRAPQALADKLRVLERGNDMVLAAHFTPLAALPSAVFSLWHNISGAIVAAWLARRPLQDKQA